MRNALLIPQAAMATVSLPHLELILSITRIKASPRGEAAGESKRLKR